MFCLICVLVDIFFFLCYLYFCCFFFFNDTATTEIYTLSLHDALPLSRARSDLLGVRLPDRPGVRARHRVSEPGARRAACGGAARSRGQRGGGRAGPRARAHGGGARLSRGAAAAPHGSCRAARRARRPGGVPV